MLWVDFSIEQSDSRCRLNPQLERQTNIFIVRVWREYLVCEAPVLRGEVEDLTHHERHPFSGIQELEQLVRDGCMPDGTDAPVDLHQAHG
jgi:hypothetical protein